MIRSPNCSMLLRLWPSGMTMANSSPPMRPTWPARAAGSGEADVVAAHAPDMAVGADLVDQALGDRAQHGVALGVAEGVVDRLEAVQIEEQDGAGDIAGGRCAQRLTEQLADAAAIGQAGQYVDIGE